MDTKPGHPNGTALTADQLDTLRHMLGINTPDAKIPEPYRDYAAVNPGDPEYIELARLGMVERYRTPSPGFAYDYYRTTDIGRAAAIASHRTIRRTKAQRVYSKYLEISDCLHELTFREFLTHPHFAEARREA